MATEPKKPDHISQEDWDAVDSPELTDGEIAAMRPFKEVHPDLYESWKRGRGRPKVEAPKKPVNFRWSANIVDRVKASGKGYGERVEKAVLAALERGEI